MWPDPTQPNPTRPVDGPDPCPTLQWTNLEVLHENGNDDIDEDELCDKDEDDEVDGSNERIHATVVVAVVRVVTVITQCVLNQ